MSNESEINDLVTRYLEQNAGVYLQDPSYHLQADVLRRALTDSDDAMEAEGIPADVRVRVAKRVLYRGLDEEAAYRRMTQHAAVVRLAQRSSISIPWAAADLNPEDTA